MMPCRLAPLVVVALLCLSAAGFAQQTTRTEKVPRQPKATLREELEQRQEQIDRLQRGLTDQESAIGQTREQERAIRKELTELDRQLREGDDKLTSLAAELAEKRKLVAAREDDLARAEDKKAKVGGNLKKRLIAYHRMGSVGLLNVVFASETLPELLALDDTFRFVLSHDKEIFDQYRNTVRQLTEVKEALREETEQLEATLEEVESQRTTVAALRGRQEKLLARVKTEAALYQQAITEIMTSTEKLDRSIDEIEEQLNPPRPAEMRIIEGPPKKIKKALADLGEGDDLPTLTFPVPSQPAPMVTGFASLKGRLPKPAAGEIITSFGGTTGKFGATTVNNGIDIKAAAGTAVQAVAKGKVIYAGVLRGHGNMVIIDHGDQYYSLLSRIDNLTKKEGQQVEQSEVVGNAGGEESLWGEGVHFEIRHDRQPVDPCPWLEGDYCPH